MYSHAPVHIRASLLASLLHLNLYSDPPDLALHTVACVHVPTCRSAYPAEVNIISTTARMDTGIEGLHPCPHLIADQLG